MPNDSNTILNFIIAFYVIILAIDLAILVVTMIAYWRIASKAGYHGALSLLMLVPIANIVMLCIFAFGEWPIQRELNMLRQQLAMRGPQAPPYPYPQQAQPYPQQMPYAQGIPYPPPQMGPYPPNTSYPPDGPYPPNRSY
jgi:hypothetical protein